MLLGFALFAIMGDLSMGIEGLRNVVDSRIGELKTELWTLNQQVNASII